MGGLCCLGSHQCRTATRHTSIESSIQNVTSLHGGLWRDEEPRPDIFPSFITAWRPGPPQVYGSGACYLEVGPVRLLPTEWSSLNVHFILARSARSSQTPKVDPRGTESTAAHEHGGRRLVNKNKPRAFVTEPRPVCTGCTIQSGKGGRIPLVSVSDRGRELNGFCPSVREV